VNIANERRQQTDSLTDSRNPAQPSSARRLSLSVARTCLLGAGPGPTRPKIPLRNPPILQKEYADGRLFSIQLKTQSRELLTDVRTLCDELQRKTPRGGVIREIIAILADVPSIAGLVIQLQPLISSILS
jgi:hypothetical protein